MGALNLRSDVKGPMEIPSVDTHSHTAGVIFADVVGTLMAFLGFLAFATVPAKPCAPHPIVYRSAPCESIDFLSLSNGHYYTVGYY